jgi:hypothetical protein
MLWALDHFFFVWKRLTSVIQDFDKFFDGENMTQTDLVAWVNVGTHHLVSSRLSLS